ncbi:MAG: kelch repeat-containing protein [Planctomycetota bacterium]
MRKRLASCSFAWVGLLLVTAATAQTRWDRMPLPGPRTDAAAAFDPIRGRLVVFGGRGFLYGSETNDTWEWDGAQWLLQTPATSPPPMRLLRMFFVPTTGRCMLTGVPVNSTIFSRQVWAWDGSTWSFGGVGGLAGTGEILGFDGAGQRLLKLSQTSGGVQTTTWNGSFWAPVATTGTPPPFVGEWVFDGGRACMVMPAHTAVYELHGNAWTSTSMTPFAWGDMSIVYDPVRGGVVSYGGRGQIDPDTLGVVRLWNGSQWLLLPDGEPRRNHAAAYDTLHNRMLVVGGDYRSSRVFGDLRAFDTAWTTLADDPSPGELTSMGSATDTTRNRILAFGGAFWESPNTPAGDTWEFDGARWRLLDLPVKPSARANAAMAHYDAGGHTLLFGGLGGTGPLGDTWRIDGTGWQLVTPATAPSPRAGASMAFDSRRNVVVLVGGETAVGAVAETWEYAAGNWQLRVTGYPPASSHGGLAYDPRRERTVLYGGFAGDNTYEWDGSAWFSTNPVHRPPADVRHRCSMTWNPTRARIVLAAQTAGSAGVWEWDGADWTSTLQAPLARNEVDPQFAFDPHNERCVLLPAAMRVETMFWDSVTPATWVEYGTGCSGAGVAPTLAPLDGGRAWLGDAFTVQLAASGAPFGAITLGLSDAVWDAVPLPLSLAPAAPGCSVLASPDLAVSFLVVQGLGGMSLAIPNSTIYLGLPLFFQGYAWAPGANPLGVVTTAGGRAVLGAR